MYLCHFSSMGQNLEGSHIMGISEGTGNVLCALVTKCGGIEGAGGSLRIRQRCSLRPIGSDQGLKQRRPINRPRGPAAISL